jgi:hypothetical protein
MRPLVLIALLAACSSSTNTRTIARGDGGPDGTPGIGELGAECKPRVCDDAGTCSDVACDALAESVAQRWPDGGTPHVFSPGATCIPNQLGEPRCGFNCFGCTGDPNRGTYRCERLEDRKAFCEALGGECVQTGERDYPCVVPELP